MDEVRPETAQIGQTVPRNREGFLHAIACGEEVTAAAERNGIPRRTATRWLSDPRFKRQVSRRRGVMFSRAVGTFAQFANAAAEKLARLMDADDARVALQAARALLAAGLDLRKSVELEERLAALEAKLGGESPP